MKNLRDDLHKFIERNNQVAHDVQKVDDNEIHLTTVQSGCTVIKVVDKSKIKIYNADIQDDIDVDYRCVSVDFMDACVILKSLISLQNRK